MMKESNETSVVDRINTYSVDNVAFYDGDDTQDKFYFEVDKDSEAIAEIPDASDVIKVNLM